MDQINVSLWQEYVFSTEKIICYSICFATEGLLLESTLERLSEIFSEAEFKYV